MAFSIVPVAGDPEFLNGFDTTFLHVFRVEEDDHALIADTSVAVIEPVDCRVVLIV